MTCPPRLRKWLLQPVYVGRWFRTLGRFLLKVVQGIWKGLEWALADKTHWAVISKLLIGVLIFLAIKYGWMVNDKLNWLIKLFEPILGVRYGGGTLP